MDQSLESRSFDLNQNFYNIDQEKSGRIKKEYYENNKKVPLWPLHIFFAWWMDFRMAERWFQHMFEFYVIPKSFEVGQDHLEISIKNEVSFYFMFLL